MVPLVTIALLLLDGYVLLTCALVLPMSLLNYELTDHETIGRVLHMLDFTIPAQKSMMYSILLDKKYDYRALYDWGCREGLITAWRAKLIRKMVQDDLSGVTGALLAGIGCASQKLILEFQTSGVGWPLKYLPILHENLRPSLFENSQLLHILRCSYSNRHLWVSFEWARTASLETFCEEELLQIRGLFTPSFFRYARAEACAVAVEAMIRGLRITKIIYNNLQPPYNFSDDDLFDVFTVLVRLEVAHVVAHDRVEFQGVIWRIGWFTKAVYDFCQGLLTIVTKLGPRSRALLRGIVALIRKDYHTVEALYKGNVIYRPIIECRHSAVDIAGHMELYTLLFWRRGGDVTLDEFYSFLAGTNSWKVTPTAFVELAIALEAAGLVESLKVATAKVQWNIAIQKALLASSLPIYQSWRTAIKVRSVLDLKDGSPVTHIPYDKFKDIKKHGKNQWEKHELFVKQYIDKGFVRFTNAQNTEFGLRKKSGLGLYQLLAYSILRNCILLKRPAPFLPKKKEFVEIISKAGNNAEPHNFSAFRGFSTGWTVDKVNATFLYQLLCNPNLLQIFSDERLIIHFGDEGLIAHLTHGSNRFADSGSNSRRAVEARAVELFEDSEIQQVLQILRIVSRQA